MGVFQSNVILLLLLLFFAFFSGLRDGSCSLWYGLYDLFTLPKADDTVVTVVVRGCSGVNV